MGPTPVGLCAATYAERHVGIAEHPPGSNRGPEIDRWNTGAGVPLGSPWCMSFAHAMYAACGAVIGGGASVGNFYAWARSGGYEIGRPWRGCLVVYDWNDDLWFDHVEIVTRVLALRWRGGRFVGWVATVGGNTGNAVSRRRRWIRPGWRFARIPGPS